MELKFRENDWQKAEKKAKHEGRAAEAILRYGKYSYDADAYNAIWEFYAAPPMRKPESFLKIEQFYTPALSKTIRSLTDAEYECRLPKLLALAAEGRYSSSMLCRSFHSKWMSAHIVSFIHIVSGYVRMYYCENSLIEMLMFDDELASAGLPSNMPTEYLLALGIREGDAELIDACREAIYGDNTKVRLSRRMIQGIIRSGSDELVGDLLKLLKTAGLQEGLRQQILESADCGSADVFSRIVGFCSENDLFRFSSAVRALNAWTGFSVENTRPNSAKRLGQIASEVLTDEAERKEYLASDDLSDVWMALWGYGCHDIDSVIDYINSFISGSDRNKKLLGR